jgi:hypothetical protein
MMTYYRFSYAAPVEDGRTGTVVASDLKMARAKAWCKLIAGLPFLSYRPGTVKLTKGEEVKIGRPQ